MFSTILLSHRAGGKLPHRGPSGQWKQNSAAEVSWEYKSMLSEFGTARKYPELFTYLPMNRKSKSRAVGAQWVVPVATDRWGRPLQRTGSPDNQLTAEAATCSRRIAPPSVTKMPKNWSDVRVDLRPSEWPPIASRARAATRRRKYRIRTSARARDGRAAAVAARGRLSSPLGARAGLHSTADAAPVGMQQR